VVRGLVKNLLNDNSSEWVICGEATDGEDAVRAVSDLHPDVILLDLSLPVLHGLEVAQILRRDYSAVAVVLMSEQDLPVLARMAEAAGTPHYLQKSRLASDLIPMLRSLAGKRPA
jgi:two-component system nitrate/nitrite response regulator NarL